MSEIVTIGALAIPMERLMAIGAVLLFALMASVLARRIEADVSNVVTTAILAGAVGARAGYVALHFKSFRDDPIAILAVWQGGFVPAAGIAAAAVTLLYALRGSPALRRVLLALLTTAGLWAGVTAWANSQPMQAFPKGLIAYTAGGKPVPLDNFRGRPFVINLWATWCPPCQREMPMLVGVAADRPEMPVLLLDQGERADVIAAFLQRKSLSPSSVLIERDRGVAEATRSAALPTTIFVAADGTIRARHSGEISRAATVAGMDALVAP